MHSSKTSPHVRACDPVAAAIETNLRAMTADGYAPLAVHQDGDVLTLTYGSAVVRGETYDIALVRLASALLDDARVGESLMEGLRNSVGNAT